MKLLVVALPLFSKDMSVKAYRLHHRHGDKIFGASHDYKTLDGAMNSPGLEILNKIGVEPFTGGKPIFVGVSKFVLLMNLAAECKIPPEQVVWVLENDVPPEEPFLHACKLLKERGFGICLENIPYTVPNNPLFELADYIILDSTNQERLEEMKFLRFNRPQAVVVLKNIATIERFHALSGAANALFEGRFYNEPLTKGTKEIAPVKANLLNLLRMVVDEDFDLGEVARIIGQDPALSISLLRFINSPAIGLTSKVASIQGAIALLGQKEVRKWITVAVSTQLSEDKPSEITKLSLTRAKFAENLATAYEMGVHAPSLFMMGLFSLLNVILDMPMNEAMKQIKVNEQVEEALVFGAGKFAQVLELIHSYERGDWEGVAYNVVHNSLNIGNVSQAFVDSLLWYKLLLEEIE